MFLQYELWKDCNYNCDYCFNKCTPKKRNKLEALDYAIASIASKNIPEFSSIGLMGGEFFGGQLSNPAVKAKFYELVALIINKLGRTGRFLITTALMSKDASDWFEFCDFIHSKGYDRNTLVCTSYDRLYRFKGNTEAYWFDTLKESQERYPDLNFHVEMILTGYLISDLLSNPHYIAELSDRFKARIDFNIPYLPYCSKVTKEEFDKELPGFLPQRKQFLELLRHNIGDLDLKGICEHSYHSSELHYSLNDIDWLIIPYRDKMKTTCTNLQPCNNCCGYLDSAVKMQDDIKVFLESAI